MALTRFHDGRTGRDGPVSGGLSIIPFCFDLAAISQTREHTLDLPAGMKFRIIAINAQVRNVAGDPQVTVGSTVAGAERVAAVTLADGDLTIIAGQNDVAAGGILSVTIVNDGAADAFDSATITVYGYISAPPTSELKRS